MSDLDTILNDHPAPAADTSTPIAPASEAPATPAPTPKATEPAAAPPVAEPVAPPAPAPNVAQGDTVTYTEYDDVTCERTHTRAAMVTCVWSATCVNLTVFDPDGTTRGITSSSRGTGHGTWTERA